MRPRDVLRPPEDEAEGVSPDLVERKPLYRCDQTVCIQEFRIIVEDEALTARIEPYFPNPWLVSQKSLE
jgi:hypothetical protein